jgi:superfamily II DNA or RNA helicase
VGCWRAPAFRATAFRAWLAARRIEGAYRSTRPAAFVPAAVPPERVPALRPYQEEALRAWTAAGCRGLVALPTGSGKTRVAVRAIVATRRTSLVLVPTRQLLRQWRESIASSYPGAVGCYGDGEHDLQPITVATFESGHRYLDRLGDHFDLLIIDEAHHLVADQVKEAAEMSTARYRLGLSATFPPGAGFRELARQLIGPTCFALPISSLAGSTWLAPFDVKILPLRLTAEEQAEYDRARAKFLMRVRPFFESFPGAEWADFVRAAARSPDGREALAAFRRSREILALPRKKLVALDALLDRHREDPKLVFATDNRSAYEISRRFLIPAVTCDIGRPEREVILARFRDGVYRALVSAKVLNEGIDVPAASVAIIAGGSPSPLEHAQRVGRVLRPAPGKRAIVYELVMSGTAEWRTSERRSRESVLDGAPPV